MTRTSGDTVALGLGSKSFTFIVPSSNLGWFTGTRLRVQNSNTYMDGVVTAVSSTGVTINADIVVGSGTPSGWGIFIVGDRGPAGPAGDLAGQQLYNFKAAIGFLTGASYNTIDSDTGTLKDFNNATAITVTLSPNSPIGTHIMFTQTGAGVLSFQTTGSSVLRNRQTQFRTAGLWAVVSLYVRANSGGNAAEWVIGGDTQT